MRPFVLENAIRPVPFGAHPKVKPGIAAASREGLPCVLLTNAERNLSFYAGHGFEVVLETDTPAGPPHAWALVRSP